MQVPRPCKTDTRVFLWLKMGWEVKDGSGLVPTKTEVLLEPECLGDFREATAFLP